MQIKKHYIHKTALLGFLLLALLFTQCKSLNDKTTRNTDSLKGKNVLFVYGGYAGHDPDGCRDLLVPWLEAEGAKLTVSNSLDIYANKEVMAKTDLIIQTWTMGELTGAQANGLLEAVRNGAGIAGWHGGLCDAFRNNPEYLFMTGGQWTAHPGNKLEYTVNITDKKDPVTKGIRDFKMVSEQYYMVVDPNVKVLATTECSGTGAAWIKGCVMPVVWKKIYGKGRVFYSSLCHEANDFRSFAESLEIMKRGIRWAAESKYQPTENLVRPIYK